MRNRARATSLALAASIGLGLFAPTAASASKEGHRNTALILGAVGIYGLAKEKPLIAGLGLGGAAYAYSESRRDDRHRHRYCRKHRKHHPCRHSRHRW